MEELDERLDVTGVVAGRFNSRYRDEQPKPALQPTMLRRRGLSLDVRHPKS